MKENIYDNEVFFEKYSKMDRSVKGLQGAGEWHELKKMLPNLEGKNILDIGCGFGWHCKYAVENGAKSVIGIDLSDKMIEKARKINYDSKIAYQTCAIEEYEYPKEHFDIVISSLALHYVESFEDICRKVRSTLKNNGSFIFSVEHPIFTAHGSQDWEYNENGTIKHWPVDSYFDERLINSNFLGQKVVKYHKTLTTYINTLIQNDYSIQSIIEPMPNKEMLDTMAEMKEELRRPMMLLISAQKSN